MYTFVHSYFPLIVHFHFIIYNYYEVINKRVDELGLVKPRLFYINTVNGKTNYDEIHI